MRIGLIRLALLLHGLLGSVALAQVALPDRMLSEDVDFRANTPSLSASARRIALFWEGPQFVLGEPTTYISGSFSDDLGGTWTTVGVLPNEDPLIAIRPSAAALSSSGDVHLLSRYGCQLYSRGLANGSVLNWAPGVGFCQRAVPFSQGRDIPSIACDASGAHVYTVSTEFESETDGFARLLGSYIVLFRSSDSGASWIGPTILASETATGGSVAVAADGTVYVSWLDVFTRQVMITRSLDQGATFLPPVAAAPVLDNLSSVPLGWNHPEGIRRFIYDHGVFSNYAAANFPALAVDRSSGPTRGSVYLTWADRADGAGSPNPAVVVDTGPNDSFAQSQPVPLGCDIWGGTDYFTGTDFHDYYVFNGTAGQTISLGATILSDADGCGAELLMERADGSLLPIGLNGGNPPRLGYLDPSYTTLTRTGRYFIHVTGGTFGSSYILHLRNFEIAPGSVARDMRDIVLVRSTDGGATWSPKVRVNHDPPGSDQHFPNVSVDGRGRVYVAWYDRREGTDGLDVSVYASSSNDGGRTFGPDLRMSSRPSRWTGVGHLAGDRVAIASGDEGAVVAWMDARDYPVQQTEIWGARIVDVPTATEAVSDFEAEPLAEGVRLRWLVHDARAVSSMSVFRSESGGEETALGDPPRSGGGRTEWLDDTAKPGHDYEYRLRVTTTTGTHWLGPVGVEVPARIAALAWRSAWPNPFDRLTRVKLAVPRAAQGSVRVYDVQGKAVATLAEGAFEPGERTIEWDGRDAAGGVAAPGLYFVAAQVGSESVRMRVARVP